MPIYSYKDTPSTNTKPNTHKPLPPTQPTLNLTQAARLAGIHPETLKRWIREGRVQGQKRPRSGAAVHALSLQDVERARGIKQGYSP